MKKPLSKRRTREMRAQYDFSGGVRGKYADKIPPRNKRGAPDPELVDAFSDSKSVNDALRAFAAIAARTETRKRA